MEQVNGTKLKVLGLSVVLFFSSIHAVHADSDCKAPVQAIEKGVQAPCTGYLFSPDAESKAYKATKIVELQAEENKILQTRLEMYMKQSDVLAKEVGKRDNMDGLYKFLYFGLGVVVTGVIASNVGR